MTAAPDPIAHNRAVWDRGGIAGGRWSSPVTSDAVEAARRGEWSVLLTSTRPVPRAWFPPLAGLDVLGLASGGGQQGPLFAAAGATVTILDFSASQLAADRLVAERDGLDLTTVEGDVRDLSAFADGSFDLVFHPSSNSYVSEVGPVWREAFRVLRPGGTLLAGFSNPVVFLFDADAPADHLVARHRIPYADHRDLPPEQVAAMVAEGTPLEHGHSLDQQLGGQLDAGFHLVGLYEDGHLGLPLSDLLPTAMATRAIKPVS